MEKSLYEQFKNSWKYLKDLDEKKITAISTFVLVLVTIWYAYSTFEMVNVMKSDFEISNRPYLSVKTMDQRMDGEKLIYSYTLGNSGKIPAIISHTKVDGLSISEDDEKILSDKNESTILNPGEYLGGDLATILPDGMKQEYKIKLTIDYRTPSQSKSQYQTMYLYHYWGTPEKTLTIIDSDIK